MSDKLTKCCKRGTNVQKRYCGLVTRRYCNGCNKLVNEETENKVTLNNIRSVKREIGDEVVIIDHNHRTCVWELKEIRN